LIDNWDTMPTSIINNLNEELKTGIVILIIIFGAFVASKLFQWLIHKFIRVTSENSNFDPKQFKFLRNAVAFIIWMAAIIMIIHEIPQLKSLAIGLFAGAGILAIVIGFAGQHAFSNIISGIFIIAFRPFRVGDLIRIGDKYFGNVEDITLRHTVILNFEKNGSLFRILLSAGRR